MLNLILKLIHFFANYDHYYAIYSFGFRDLLLIWLHWSLIRSAPSSNAVLSVSRSASHAAHVSRNGSTCPTRGASNRTALLEAGQPRSPAPGPAPACGGPCELGLATPPNTSPQEAEPGVLAPSLPA